MPDPTDEMLGAVVRAIRREIQRDSSRRGINLGDQATGDRNALGGFSTPEQMTGFATGYSDETGETVMPFVFDFSELDGDDVL